MKTKNIEKVARQEAQLILDSIVMYGKRLESIILESEEAFVNKDMKRLQELEKEREYIHGRIEKEDLEIEKFKKKYKIK